MDIQLIELNSKAKEAELEQIFAEFRKVFHSSQYVLGEKVKEFEVAYAKLAGCEYGVGVNSGTDASYLAMRALGIGPGDEVITVTNSFVATVGAIVVIGAKPVLVDSDTDFNIDPTKIEEAITPKTKAIYPVHLTGNPCKMDEIMAIAKKHKLFVVEDAAQSIGAKYKGKPVGSFGDAAAFSLHPLKNLHVWGDGGIITTNSKELAENCKLQRNHGMVNRDEVAFFSFNSRLDTLQAIVGLSSLKHLSDTLALRKRHAEIYDERLATLSDYVIRPIWDREHVEHGQHLYVVRVKERESLMKYLTQNGVETKVHYPIPVHLQEAAKDLGYKKGDFPVAEDLCDHILSLPIRENLQNDQINYVCDLLDKFYN